MENPAGGIALTVVAGAVGSSTLMPVKYVQEWKWENTWLAYSFFAYFLFPWLAAIFSVPHLVGAYSRAGGRVVLFTALFGLLWGVGVVMYGLALDIVGLSLTSGIILGSSVALGSFIPLLVIDPSRVLTRSGANIRGADAVMIAGVLTCARAGGLREKALTAGAPEPGTAHFMRGILICFLAGMLSPLLNVALTFGGQIAHNALELGASPFNAANAVWGLAVSMGSLPSIAFCLIKLSGNGTWGAYRTPASKRNTILCFLMGVFFMSSTALYGSAVGVLGVLGPVVGWPMYMSALIIGNNFWGWYTSEWKGVHGVPVWTMFTGITLQIVAIVLLSSART